MSLRSKIVLILSAVVVLYAVTDYAVQQATVSRSFQSLEENEARADAWRVKEALFKKVAQLNEVCVNWASWQATYDFMGDGNDQYRSSTLGQIAYELHDIDVLVMVDASGAVVWRQIRDPKDGQPISLAEFSGDHLPPHHRLLRLSRTEDAQIPAGVFDTEFLPLMVASHAIQPAPGVEARGRLILGRFIDDALRDEVHLVTRVSFDLWAIDDVPPVVAQERDRITSAVNPVVVERDDDFLDAYTFIEDFWRNPTLIVRANVARKISATGADSLRYARNSTVAAALIMLLVLVGLIQKTILTPVSALTKHAVQIGHTDDLSTRFDLERNDEVGILSREFNTLMEKLAQSRVNVVEAARSAGMSEIATGILHNVGNVLNSVNVSASLISRKIQKMGVDDLKAVAGVLQQHSDDLATFVSTDERGKHLQPFLTSLAAHLDDEQHEIVGELESLNKGIEHIRQLVTSQQSYAVRSDLVEWALVTEQIEEALKITKRAVSGTEAIQVAREYDPEVPKVRVDRHKLLEILVNLIQNARQAMQEGGHPTRRLTLRTKRAPDRVRIEIEDDGVGIAKEHLVKMFTLGFTTKEYGHGFGLHTSANAATEMGGSLTAFSDGPGEGALFVLELPCEARARVGAPS